MLLPRLVHILWFLWACAQDGPLSWRKPENRTTCNGCIVISLRAMGVPVSKWGAFQRFKNWDGIS